MENRLEELKVRMDNLFRDFAVIHTDLTGYLEQKAKFERDTLEFEEKQRLFAAQVRTIAEEKEQIEILRDESKNKLTEIEQKENMLGVHMAKLRETKIDTEKAIEELKVKEKQIADKTIAFHDLEEKAQQLRDQETMIHKEKAMLVERKGVLDIREDRINKREERAQRLIDI